MKSLNKVMLIGSVGKDPELKYTTSGKAVANFSLALSESWKGEDGEKQEKTEWVNIVAWQKLAEIIGEYVKKGGKVYIEGRLQTRSYDKEGVKRYVTEIVADNMLLLGDKSKTTQGDTPSNNEAPKDDGLPFVWLLPLIPTLCVVGETML